MGLCVCAYSMCAGGVGGVGLYVGGVRASACVHAMCVQVRA